MKLYKQRDQQIIEKIMFSLTDWSLKGYYYVFKHLKYTTCKMIVWESAFPSELKSSNLLWIKINRCIYWEYTKRVTSRNMKIASLISDIKIYSLHILNRNQNRWNIQMENIRYYCYWPGLGISSGALSINLCTI